jgi:hypothetical protein
VVAARASFVTVADVKEKPGKKAAKPTLKSAAARESGQARRAANQMNMRVARPRRVEKNLIR